MNKFRHYGDNKGFSLVELSIAIIIVGLIIGAVLSGMSILEGAKARSVVSDISRFKDAIARFNEQYGGLPGDLAWGTTAPFSASGYTLNAGNGDGVVQWSSASHPTSSQESYQAWLHLTASELLQGIFSGAAQANNAAVINTNVPASKYDNAGYTFYNVDNVTGGGNDASQFYSTAPVPVPATLVGNYIAFGSAETNSYTSGAAITATDAQGIDSKVDDGIPNSGAVLGTAAQTSPLRCITVTNAPANEMEYATSTQGIACNLYFNY